MRQDSGWIYSNSCYKRSFQKIKKAKRLKNVMKTSNFLSSCDTFNYALALLIGRKWMELSLYRKKKSFHQATCARNRPIFTRIQDLLKIFRHIPPNSKRLCAIEILDDHYQNFPMMTQVQFFFSIQTVASLIARKWMDKMATFFLLSLLLHFDFQF